MVFRFFSHFGILPEQFCFNLFSPNNSGVGAARSGNLTFMVGGVEDEFAAAKELLGCMGSNVMYCGAVGTGQVMLSHD